MYLGTISFDASSSNSIYGNSNTVQPQSVKVLYYVVIATSTKTQIQVDLDNIATDLNGKADVDLTNINASCKALDGQWVDSNIQLANAVASPTTETSYSLANYLPNDGYNYEILCAGSVTTGTTSGNFARLAVKSDLLTNAAYVCGAITRTSSSEQAYGSCIIPVGAGRSVTLSSWTSNTGTYTLYIRGYRRIGTNS